MPNSPQQLSSFETQTHKTWWIFSLLLFCGAVVWSFLLTFNGVHSFSTFGTIHLLPSIVALSSFREIIPKWSVLSACLTVFIVGYRIHTLPSRWWSLFILAPFSALITASVATFFCSILCSIFFDSNFIQSWKSIIEVIHWNDLVYSLFSSAIYSLILAVFLAFSFQRLVHFAQRLWVKIFTVLLFCGVSVGVMILLDVVLNIFRQSHF